MPLHASTATTCSANDKRLNSGRCVYAYYLGAEHARHVLFRGRFLPDRVVRSFTNEVFEEMVATKELVKWTQDEVTAKVSSAFDSSLFLFPSWLMHSPSFLA